MNIIVVVGPTATGKTDLGLGLAKKFNGEIISADSRQVYQGLDIGAGKYPGNFKRIDKQKGMWVVDGVPIYLYDQVSLNQVFAAADFVQIATRIIADIHSRGKLPIIVGGTNFYIKALLTQIPNLNLPVNENLRKELVGYSLLKLQQRLQKINLRKWDTMNHSDRQNPRRLIRAIEVGSVEPAENKILSDYSVLKIGLTAKREVLYQRVDERVISRISQGMIEEAQGLIKSGVSSVRLKELGLEYGVLADYISGRTPDLVKTMQGKIHEYVRRQLTWLKKEKDIAWFDVTEKNCTERVAKKVSQWYHISDDKTD